MAEDHVITAAQAEAAKAEPIVPSEFRRPPPIPGADWFTEEVRRQLIAQFGADVTTQGGLMVRTSLDPTLQTAAEKAVRDGLMAYDRKLGGWRGPVGTSRRRAGSGDELGGSRWRRWHGRRACCRTGSSPWCSSATDGEARLGWLDAGRAQTPQPRTGALLLSDLAWARPVRDGKPGPAPRRMADVVQQGDVVMVEPPSRSRHRSTPPATERASRCRRPLPRMALRQIPLVQGALVSLDPTTGRVLAMVGGWSFERASSTAPRRRSASLAPASSRSSI